MKATLLISIIALFLSATSLFMILTRPVPTISEVELDRMIDAALLKKEKLYVQAMAPKLDAIYKDMLGPRYVTPEIPPESFAELFKPAINIVTQMSTQQ